jgi:hypothetical protein
MKESSTPKILQSSEPGDHRRPRSLLAHKKFGTEGHRGLIHASRHAAVAAVQDLHFKSGLCPKQPRGCWPTILLAEYVPDGWGMPVPEPSSSRFNPAADLEMQVDEIAP